MYRIGFDNEKYLQEQTQCILERMAQNDGKLYLECGGKLMYDYHASRVLPGFDPNVKMRVFQSFRDKLDVIICIYAGDIVHKKFRSDFGITYDTDVFKMIDDFAKAGIKADKVLITRFKGEKAALDFKEHLEGRGIKVYVHEPTNGYPMDVDKIVSDEGYGANAYIPTDKPIVLVTAPGPGSGKLATCLNQMYHDYKQGRKSGYSKFETFPIWNLPIDHPVNIAYEAATADIGDVNIVDYFYMQATGKMAVNYNRDLEAFPILKSILEKITGKSYNSPTDMGVNRDGFGIIDDEAVRYAGQQEIIRRYYRSACERLQGKATLETLRRTENIMQKAGLKPTDRPAVNVCQVELDRSIAKGKGADGITCAAAMELKSGEFITAHNSPVLHASSALVLNAVKSIAQIPKKIDLIPNMIIESVTSFKRDHLLSRGVSLNLEETLICLAMSSSINPAAKVAIDSIDQLRGCEVHLSHMPSDGDANGIRKLGLNATSEPIYPTSNLYNF